jgi:hypothetical protein
MARFTAEVTSALLKKLYYRARVRSKRRASSRLGPILCSPRVDASVLHLVERGARGTTVRLAPSAVLRSAREM